MAAALRPDSHGVRCHLGTALIDAGRWDEAAVAYRHAIRLKADYCMAHFGLGSALGEQGQFEEAIVACRRAIELKPDDAEPTTGSAHAFFAGADSTRRWLPYARPSPWNPIMPRVTATWGSRSGNKGSSPRL